MNTYTAQFFSACPHNGIRILYTFVIETHLVIEVEKIIATVGELSSGLHENFADTLFAAFGGKQTLTADHHGVTIQTKRTTS